MGAGWPLTGREPELAAVMSAIGRARQGCGGVVLAGPAGVGKTRLAREALDRAARQGRWVRWAVGTASAQQVPLGAFGDLVEGGAEPADTIRRAARGLSGGYGHGILVVDDAHLLDDASALLVHQLALYRATALLLTVRTGMQPPDAVTALWKDGHLARLDVAPLSAETTAELLGHALPGPILHDTVRALWDLTRGNVLFLRQLVQDEQRSGRLRRSDGCWSWSGRPELTEPLSELVDAEMGRLDPAAAMVMDLLTLGEPLPLAVLRRLSDDAVLESLERQGLLRTDPVDFQVRIAHPLYGEARRSRMGTLTARRLRGRLATELVGPDLVGASLLRCALLALESDLPPDPELFTRAALAAARLVDLDTSERLARAAVAAGGGFVPGLTAAMAVSFRSRGAEAEAILGALADETIEPGQRQVLTVCRAANQLWTLGRPDRALQIVEQARVADGPRGPAPCFDGIESAVLAARGRPRRAMQLGRSATAAEPAAPVAVMIASYGLVGALAVTGSVEELGPAAARGYQVTEDHPEVSFLQFGLAHLHLIGLQLAGAVEAMEHVVEVRRREAAYLPGQAHTYCLGLRAHLALARGQLGTALSFLDEALERLGAVEGTGFRYLGLLHRGLVLARLGRPEQARADLDQICGAPHPAFAFLAPEVGLARAWIAAAEGSTDRAISACHEAAETARAMQAPAYEVQAWHTAVGFGDRTAGSPLQTLARSVAGARIEAAVAQGTALHRGDADGLLAAAEALTTMGDLIAAANAAAQAAHRYGRQGRRGSAALARARAVALHARCEGALTPALTGILRPLPLTGRQREIALLISTGLSNQEIARRLVLSVRTVEGHVFRACAQLGVTDRSELALAVDGSTDRGGSRRPVAPLQSSRSSSL